VFPNGWQQALTLLLAVVPGFIYQGTRSHLRGPSPDERETSVRVIRALAVSAFLALLYVAVLGHGITDAVTHPSAQLKDQPRTAAWEMIGLVFGVPIVAAFCVHLASVFSVSDRITELVYKIIGKSEKISPYDPTPTAWDYAGNYVRKGYVRVLTKDGTFLGGYLGEKSYLTGYPEPHELFLEQAWVMNDTGEFLYAAAGKTGAWIRCDDAQLVQFVEQNADGTYAQSEREQREREEKA
jgi:uncharacterized protein DUF6338